MQDRFHVNMRSWTRCFGGDAFGPKLSYYCFIESELLDKLKLLQCYFEFLEDLEKKINGNWDEISSSLEDIRKSLLSKKGCLVNMTADEKNHVKSCKYMEKFLESFPNTQLSQRGSWNTQLSPMNEAIIIPTQVNYVGKAANLYEAGYHLSGSAYVISKYIGNTWLWDRVRVSGGAYGGFCDFDTHSGVFSYLSYRDPNLLKTLDVHDGTEDFLRQLELDNDALIKAIIGTIGDVDSYKLPDAKGYSRYKYENDRVIDAASSDASSPLPYQVYGGGKNGSELSTRGTNNQLLERQDPLVTKGDSLVPLLGIDVWEHAYYLQRRRDDEETMKFLTERLIVMRKGASFFLGVTGYQKIEFWKIKECERRLRTSKLSLWIVMRQI